MASDHNQDRSRLGSPLRSEQGQGQQHSSLTPQMERLFSLEHKADLQEQGKEAGSKCELDPSSSAAATVSASSVRRLVLNCLQVCGPPASRSCACASLGITCSVPGVAIARYLQLASLR